MSYELRVGDWRLWWFDWWDIGPHPPSPSPKGKERCCKSLIICITTTSSLNLCSAFSQVLITFEIFEKQGLRFGGFSASWRRKSEGGILLNIFELLISISLFEKYGLRFGAFSASWRGKSEGGRMGFA